MFSISTGGYALVLKGVTLPLDLWVKAFYFRNQTTFQMKLPHLSVLSVPSLIKIAQQGAV